MMNETLTVAAFLNTQGTVIDCIHNYFNPQVKNVLACVAGVQRGGMGEVKFEREVRGERETRSSPTIALRTFLAVRARI